MKATDIEKVKAGHPVQTRDGRNARVICFDVKAKEPYALALVDHDGMEYVYSFYEDLNCMAPPSYDLILAPHKVRIDDLSGLKVGDGVYDLMYGSGTVISITQPTNGYPVVVKLNTTDVLSYTRDGRQYSGCNQTLFLSNPELIINEIEVQP